jgi:hypothetical protein
MDGQVVQVRLGQDDWEYRRALSEGQSAILMVAHGHARVVGLHNFGFSAEIAPVLLPLAQRLRIALRIERPRDGPISLIVGPRGDVNFISEGEDVRLVRSEA